MQSCQGLHDIIKLKVRARLSWIMGGSDKKGWGDEGERDVSMKQRSE